MLRQTGELTSLPTYPHYIERAINDVDVPVEDLVQIIDVWLDAFVLLGRTDVFKKYMEDSHTNNIISSYDYVRRYK